MDTIRREQKALQVEEASFGGDQPSINEDLGEVSMTARKRHLPRFTISHGSSSSDDLQSDKAVDSNKTLASVLYVKKLLTKAINVLQGYKEEK